MPKANIQLPQEGDLLFEKKLDSIYNSVSLFGALGVALYNWKFIITGSTVKTVVLFFFFVLIFFCIISVVQSLIFLFVGVFKIIFVKGFKNKTYEGFYFHDKIVISRGDERSELLLRDIEYVMNEKDEIRLVPLPRAALKNFLFNVFDKLELSKKYKKHSSEVVDFLNQRVAEAKKEHFYKDNKYTIKDSAMVACPLCLGKGIVGSEDIKRVKRIWTEGKKCPYCIGSGKIKKNDLFPYLSELSSTDERIIIGDLIWNEDDGTWDVDA